MFSNPHSELALSYDEARYLVRAPRACFPSGHPVGWYFEALAVNERDQPYSVVGTGTYGQLLVR